MGNETVRAHSASPMILETLRAGREFLRRQRRPVRLPFATPTLGRFALPGCLVPSHRYTVTAGRWPSQNTAPLRILDVASTQVPLMLLPCLSCFLLFWNSVHSQTSHIGIVRRIPVANCCAIAMVSRLLFPDSPVELVISK